MRRSIAASSTPPREGARAKAGDRSTGAEGAGDTRARTKPPASLWWPSADTVAGSARKTVFGGSPPPQRLSAYLRRRQLLSHGCCNDCLSAPGVRLGPRALYVVHCAPEYRAQQLEHLGSDGCVYACRIPLAYLAWPAIPLSAFILRIARRCPIGGLAPRRVYRDHGVLDRGYYEGL
jgi:hypothetical protein